MNTKLTIVALIQAGFIWGCTSAWSNVVLAATNYLYPNSKSEAFKAKLYYAIFLTVIVVILFYVLVKINDSIKQLPNMAQDAINNIKKKVIVNSDAKIPVHPQEGLFAEMF